MKNEDLKIVYDQIYRDGERDFFSKFVEDTNISETDSVVLSSTNWKGKTVLDVGCGTGKTAYLISQAGAKYVTGIDYSRAAIEEASQSYRAPNLAYCCMDLSQWSDSVDIIVSCGTLEHMNCPRDTLIALGRFISGDGRILITCPCFLNIRGFIWMALQLLLEVPMSLTDLHFISPFDIEAWLKDTDLRLIKTSTLDQSRANGPLMVEDLRHRLTNALEDASLNNSRVAHLTEWLDKVVNYIGTKKNCDLEGATALYVIGKG